MSGDFLLSFCQMSKYVFFYINWIPKAIYSSCLSCPLMLLLLMVTMIIVVVVVDVSYDYDDDDGQWRKQFDSFIYSFMFETGHDLHWKYRCFLSTKHFFSISNLFLFIIWVYQILSEINQHADDDLNFFVFRLVSGSFSFCRSELQKKERKKK